MAEGGGGVYPPHFCTKYIDKWSKGGISPFFTVQREWHIYQAKETPAGGSRASPNLPRMQKHDALPRFPRSPSIMQTTHTPDLFRGGRLLWGLTATNRAWRGRVHNDPPFSRLISYNLGAGMRRSGSGVRASLRVTRPIDHRALSRDPQNAAQNKIWNKKKNKNGL